MTPKQIGAVIVGALAIIIVIVAISSTLTTVDAGEIIVKQNVLDGELQVWSEPGIEWQNFGGITEYTKSNQYWFGGQPKLNEEGKRAQDVTIEDCLSIRFNDQGTAKVCGSVSFDLPTDEKSMIALHERFRSQHSIEERLIKPALAKAIYNSGPLMSSRESAGDRRAELTTFIRDQATEGIFEVSVEEEEVPDLFAAPIEAVEMMDVPVLDEETGEPVIENGKPKMMKKGRKVMRHPTKVVKIVSPKRDGKGNFKIGEPSAVKEYNIRLYNLTVNRIVYDDRVKKQIARQQEATMAIQTAQAHAQKAEQDAVTARAEGEAKVATVKAEQEVEKQKQVTQAEARLDVAKQDLETAKTRAEATRVTADAEAYAKQKAIQADGALDKKLKAYVETQKVWAAAAAKQRLVPEVQMGGNSGNAGSGLDSFMSVRAAQAAKDLQLNLAVK